MTQSAPPLYRNCPGEARCDDVSWQKVLGGEGDGVLILSRAVERLESYTPPGRCRRSSASTKGKLIEGIFQGETINTPSMLANEDYLVALKWAKQWRAERPDCPRRCERESRPRFLRRKPPGISETQKTRLRRPRPASASSSPIPASPTARLAKAVAKRIEKVGAGFDLGAYRDAPPGLRIWCGSTVETADVQALMPWIARRLRRRDRRAGAGC